MFSATVVLKTIPPQIYHQTQSEPRLSLEFAAISCIVELYKIFKIAAHKTKVDRFARSNPYQAGVEVIEGSEFFRAYIRNVANY